MSHREIIRAIYDEVAPAYAAALPDLRAEQPLDRALLRVLAEEVREAGGDRVLDAGCGTGRLVGPLQELGLRVVGADLSPAMVAEARSAMPEAEFHVADLAELPFDDESFDGVVAWYSLIHHDASSLHAALAELARVVRDDGRLLTAFHAGTGQAPGVRAYGTAHTMPKHLREAAEIADMLHRTGWTTTATMRREPVHEQHAQGFVMARRRPSRSDD
jgi:ubiquinone/menaquinone biosynthesis C-methylase UbiE